MKNSLITPRTLKGFRDYLPAAMIPRERLMETARGVYRSYGFAPIETPSLEYAEILCGKGGDEADRQMFRFEDHGGRDVGMRFDLTVPLARFVAQHANDVGLPFKRYHIGTVWRGEKPQVGRYREFSQCDFDTIGTKSLAADIETTLVIHDLFRAIGFEKFTIRVNNRKVLNGLLEQAGLMEHSVHVLRAIDKLPKVGRDAVVAELESQTPATGAQIEQILQLAALKGTPEEVLGALRKLVGQNELGMAGIAELQELTDVAVDAGVDRNRLIVDPSIARGLDYYTGTIYETFLDDLPSIGSVCSGGRYDNLAELFSKQQLPGVGASLGLDRLLTAMETLGMLEPRASTADVLVVQFESSRLADYFRLAGQLRRSGIPTEVFPEPKKLGQQFKYADRRGHHAVVIAGSDEFERGEVQIKWMADGKQVNVPYAGDATAIVEVLQSRLAKT